LESELEMLDKDIEQLKKYQEIQNQSNPPFLYSQQRAIQRG
jgi:hypothetical protein